MKLHLGRNQWVVPFLEASYIFSYGKYYSNFEYPYSENYTEHYIRHIISGGIGLKIYASRWLKKTKYKNNFGIETSFSKALLLFDNTLIVPLLDRSSYRLSFFYRF
ncbi:MAG: hypothetical protein LBU51_08115 [Bacteroidales bacterium]|nr:hypothetical protein [Bacteroidales bacterium]